MFGPEQPVELSLLGSPQGQAKLDPIQMELFDCAFPMLTEVRATSDPVEAFAGADWVILLGSIPYGSGLQRTELLLANGPIYRNHGHAINEAAPSARVLVVANPCNTNCLIARSVAPDVPPEHWFALTRLDQSRARALIAEKAKVSPDRVTRVIAWGRHGPTIYPDFHNSLIDDRPAPEVIDDPQWVRATFEPGARERGPANPPGPTGAPLPLRPPRRSSGPSVRSSHPPPSGIASVPPWSPTAATESPAA